MQTRERPATPVFDAALRRNRKMPSTTRWRWLKELPPPIGKLLDNPDLARAIADEAERRAAEQEPVAA